MTVGEPSSLSFTLDSKSDDRLFGNSVLGVDVCEKLRCGTGHNILPSISEGVRITECCRGSEQLAGRSCAIATRGDIERSENAVVETSPVQNQNLNLELRLHLDVRHWRPQSSHRSKNPFLTAPCRKPKQAGRNSGSPAREVDPLRQQRRGSFPRDLTLPCRP